MLNPTAKLNPDLFSDNVAKAPTRDGFGKGVVEAGKNDPNVVVLCADLSESTRAEWFQKEFPNRFIEMGVAEQGMATVGAGMAAVGKIPFITSYAAFSPGRNYEQIRTTIALNQLPVKIMGMHAGISVGPDGATHQMLEDMALMRVLPNMLVLNPGDAEEARKAVVVAAKSKGPVYIRFGRSATPTFTTLETPFEIGKAIEVWTSEKPKVAIFSTGSLTHNALLAARALETRNVFVSVTHFASIKPLDTDAAVQAAKKTAKVVTLEEHQIMGGFGSAISECLSEQYPVKVVRLGIHDQFGQSGDPSELIEYYGMGVNSIVTAVEQLVNS